MKEKLHVFCPIGQEKEWVFERAHLAFPVRGSLAMLDFGSHILQSFGSSELSGLPVLKIQKPSKGCMTVSEVVEIYVHRV
ncbi:hypothetical protein AVEN_81110-1 [Araneus ventricosus]|uniref:Uncharacterized protein n=1 Tax=Araneus ventricosus TaxID=182803 RepID=A0A4Y2DX05_ARAVE|nr:hypothetical protein AVEN_81110-1 [Araneus ventricosus]